MEEKIRIGISSCLLGEKVRYDGGDRLDRLLRDTMGKYIDWKPVCPETEYGLPVPREPMRLEGDPFSPCLVTISTKIDRTKGMRKWAGKKVREIRHDLCGFVLKSRSPSCGMHGIKVYGSSGIPVRSGSGIFAASLVRNLPLLPVEDEERLSDPLLRENFISRIFVFRRWKDLIRKRASAGRLVSFHSDHKLLILSHSPGHCAVLGRIVADAKKYRPEDLFDAYGSTLMEGLRLVATPGKNTNVLLHIMGYFRTRLKTGEKQELTGAIRDYRAGSIPLIVPATLLSHYAGKYNERYIENQWYLKPDPLELMLRNHS